MISEVISFFTSNTGILAGAVAIVAGVFFKVLADARSYGRMKEREEARKKADRVIEVSDEIDDAVAGRSATENRDRLKRW